MIQLKRCSGVSTRILGLMCAASLIGWSASTFAGGPPPTGKPAIREDRQEPTQAAPATTQTPKPAARFPLPSATVAAVDGSVTLRLVNNTNAVIEYQLVGRTRERVLGQQSKTDLQAASPLTMTYQRQDNGLLLVTPKTVAPGVLEVRFDATNDLDVDTKSLEINDTGTVFLN